MNRKPSGRKDLRFAKPGEGGSSGTTTSMRRAYGIVAALGSKPPPEPPVRRKATTSLGGFRATGRYAPARAGREAAPELPGVPEVVACPAKAAGWSAPYKARWPQVPSLEPYGWLLRCGWHQLSCNLIAIGPLTFRCPSPMCALRNLQSPAAVAGLVRARVEESTEEEGRDSKGMRRVRSRPARTSAARLPSSPSPPEVSSSRSCSPSPQAWRRTNEAAGSLAVHRAPFPGGPGDTVSDYSLKLNIP